MGFGQGRCHQAPVLVIFLVVSAKFPISAIPQSLTMKAVLLLLVSMFASHAILPAAYQEIHVSNATEFLKAIGSDRTIVLAAGEYDLSKQISLAGDHFNFRKHADGRELFIFDVDDLTIKSSNGALPHVWTQPSFGTVMNFERCKNLRILGLRVGHGPQAGYCTGGVLDFQDCANVVVNACRLYGSGNQGFLIRGCNGFLSINTWIEECSISIMDIEGSEHLFFKDCTFRNNSGLQQVRVGESAAITFKGCAFDRNRVTRPEGEGYFFLIDSATVVELIDCSLHSNESEFLARSPLRLKLQNSQVADDNVFHGGLWPKESPK